MLSLFRGEKVMGLILKNIKNSIKVKKLNESGMTIIIITHDRDVADSCERVVEISDGNIA